MGYRSAFFWGSFALMLCTLNTLALVTRANVRVGLPDRLFMLGSDSVETLISRIMMLPFLTLAAKLTPEGMEATCFGFFRLLFDRLLGDWQWKLWEFVDCGPSACGPYAYSNGAGTQDGAKDSSASGHERYGI